MGFFSFTPEKKNIEYTLAAVHISGKVNWFRISPEKGKTLHDYRKEADDFLNTIKETRETYTNVGLTERDIVLSFGHHRIRFYDYSSFTIVETT